MSGSASLTLEQGILQHTLGIAAMAFPARVYVALCAASLPPSESVGGVEAFGGGYARVAATFALLASPTNIAANTTSVEFPLATTDWGSLGYFEIWTAQAGGSRLYWGGLVDPVSGNATTLDVSAGDIVRFSAGTLAVQATAPTPSGVSGVSSFNTRAGAVILSNSDVVGVLPPSANPPLMDGAASVGTSAAWARGDHVHPQDAGIAANAAAAGHNVGRNLLHNPLFNVAQRGVGPWTANGYTLDRWIMEADLDTVSYAQTVADDAKRAAVGDEAMQYFVNNAFTGNAGAGAFNILEQRIENVLRLSGKTITVSFYAAASAGLKLGVSIDQSFGTGGSPSATVSGNGQSITLSAAWARYSLTFTLGSSVGKTLGSNNDHHTRLNFWYSSGTTFALRAGSIGAQSGTIQLWGVQLEVGSVATPLEKPDPRYDLSNCQRFFQIIATSMRLFAVGAGGLFDTNVSFPTMRATPTVITTTGGTTLNLASGTVSVIGPGSGRMEISPGAAGDAYGFGWLTSLSADL